MRERSAHQGVDVSYPERTKSGLSIEVTGEPPFGSFSYCTFVQSGKSEHIQPFAFTFLRNIVCVRFQREVLLGLPKTNQPQPVHHDELGRDGIWGENMRLICERLRFERSA